jgi:hypothetical protein
LIVSRRCRPEIEFFQSGGYERYRPQVPVSSDLNDIEPGHQKEAARENQNQWERDLAGVIESHCHTSITILMGRGPEFSRFSVNRDLLPANAALARSKVIFMLLC